MTYIMNSIEIVIILGGFRQSRDYTLKGYDLFGDVMLVIVLYLLELELYFSIYNFQSVVDTWN